jgi:hypothetical protein
MTNPLCRSLLIVLGWVVFSLLAYKATTTKIDNKIYDPFEILGIKSVSLGCQWSLAADTLPQNICVLTSHPFIEYFGKGHQVSLQKALQNTVSILPFHPSSIVLFTINTVILTK